jgi:dienelactone hydrolase
VSAAAGLPAQLTAFVRAAPPRAEPGPGAPLADRVRAALGVLPDDGTGGADRDVRVEGRWSRDGLVGEQVSWDPGFGPRTEAWVLRPEVAEGPLPGVLLAHCHGGRKRWGKEKVSDGPAPGPADDVAAFRAQSLGDRPAAEHLARAGFAVLVHDAPGWGSRRWPVEDMPPAVRERAADLAELAERRGAPLDATARYDLAAGLHEHELAKLCGALGTSFAALVLREDAIALGVLAGHAGVDAGRVAAVGFSGGGWRAGLLAALDERCAAAVVVAMMSSVPPMVPTHVAQHTWMFFTPGLWRVCDWPELAGSRAPLPLLVLAGRRDPLVPPEGLELADAELRRRYAAAGAPHAYEGRFCDGGHVFDAAQQDDAAAWLARVL